MSQRPIYEGEYLKTSLYSHGSLKHGLLSDRSLLNLCRETETNDVRKKHFIQKKENENIQLQLLVENRSESTEFKTSVVYTSPPWPHTQLNLHLQAN
ncbi:hypothetical protein V6N11_074830 [Hibiscus sabdariffa]|uniref:Uncharacterized protein n=1 Tax=Hibiscus sabdariffa TaxID=183260 RepID=A0ABR2R4R1_9ROSI